MVPAGLAFIKVAPEGMVLVEVAPEYEKDGQAF